MFTRKPFTGSQRGLVLAIDIGTTYSGISFSVLDPGVVPEIKSVTRFPAQTPGGASKIPSVLYYDTAGIARAIGAETLLESTLEQAEDEQWFKVEWFKMHLRPRSGTMLHVTNQPEIPSLPPQKSLVEVFADFIRYLFSCAKSFIEETLLPDGVGFWASVKDRIVFVISHPNGWEGAQQSCLRRAAVLAGLISDKIDDQERIHLVTEGEASLHFCITHGLEIKEDEGIIVVDCGGGTIDLSTYSSNKSGYETVFEEITKPECCFAGSIFVTEESRKYFQDKLRGSQFDADVSRITECFDQTTKLQFRSIDEPSYVRFGGVRDRDPALDIRSGQMKIPGSVVARFFKPSVKTILEAVATQRIDSRKAIKTVFLVGGFAASPWLLNKLKEDLQSLGLDVHRPDTHVNKAVSDGAVSFYLDHFVKTRVSRSAYGLRCLEDYDAGDPEHRRRGFVSDSVSGVHRVGNKFEVILQKDAQISEAEEFRAPFFCETFAPLQALSTSIIKYSGVDEDPSWTDVDPKMYTTACVVTADVSQISRNLVPRRNPSGSPYYRLKFDVVLLFGMTELKAQISWKEGGIEKRSRAEVVYEERY